MVLLTDNATIEYCELTSFCVESVLPHMARPLDQRELHCTEQKHHYGETQTFCPRPSSSIHADGKRATTATSHVRFQVRTPLEQMHLNTPSSILIHLLVVTAIPLDTSTMDVVRRFQLDRLSVVGRRGGK